MPSQRISQTIIALRFPLIVLAVLLHCVVLGEPIQGKVYVASSDYPALDSFVHWLYADVAAVAVPLFFFISGFLMFYHVEQYTKEVWQNKLKRRVRSLFVPYVFWDIAFILFFTLCIYFVPSMANARKLLWEFSMHDWITALWSNGYGLRPLWYVRDLMFINLFAPAIYWLNRLGGGNFTLFVGFILCVYGGITFLNIGEGGIGFDGFFYYTLGAWFSINQKNFISVFSKYKVEIVFSYVAFTIAELYLYATCVGSPLLSRFVNISLIVSGIFTFSGITGLYIAPRFTPSKLLAESSFFVYLFHMFIVYIPMRLWVYVLPVNGVTVWVVQLAMPLVVSFACVGVYWCMKKILPRFTAVVTGGR